MKQHKNNHEEKEKSLSTLLKLNFNLSDKKEEFLYDLFPNYKKPSLHMIRFNSRTFRLNNRERLKGTGEMVLDLLLYINPNTYEEDVREMVNNSFKNQKNFKDYMNSRLGRD